MLFTMWPWNFHGKKRPLRRQQQATLLVEILEDRLALSATLPAHDIWRAETFRVDDVAVANLNTRGRITAQASTMAAQSSSFGSIIHLDQAFANYAYRGDGYSVAIIDTGIDYNNKALGGGWGKRVVAGYDFANNDADPMDDNGHGTHVAGIIGSSDATYGGVAPNVNLIALKVLDSSGSGSFGAVEDALKWVADHQAQYNIVAINLSLGSGNYTVNPYSFLEDEFTTLKSEGVFISIASGNGYYSNNSQQGLAYPAVSPQVVSVGAVWAGDFGAVSWASGAKDYSTGADRITSFTQRGPALSLLAPGALITSTYLNNTFRAMAGTSMASPVVAGAAAILHQALDSTGHHSQANQNYILSLMQSTGATVNDGDNENDNVTNTGLNFKRLDIYAALKGISTPSVNAPPVLAAIPSQNLTAGQPLVVTLNATDPNGDPITFSAKVLGGGGNSQAYTLDQSLGLNYAGSYYTNNYGANEKWLIGNNNQWYCILPNGEVRLWKGTMSATLQAAALIATLDATFYADPSLLWNAQPGSAAPATLSLVGNKLTIQTPANFKGTFSVEVTASDGTLSTKQTFTVNAANAAPVLKVIANQTLTPGQPLAIALSATDPNGDAITYSARVVSGSQFAPAATFSFSGNQLSVQAPAGFKGTFVVEVTASDGTLNSKQSFTVTVPNVAPVLAAIPNQTLAAGKALTIALNGSDANGDAVTYTARVLGGGTASPAYRLKQQLGLTYAGSYYTNTFGAQEKWLIGSNNQWYLILPNGELRRWSATIQRTLQPAALVAKLDTSFYKDPSLLWNAAPSVAAPVSVTVTGNSLKVQAPAGTKGSFDVEVTASDGSLTVKRTFTVTV